jgi:hypothetical protein
MLITSPKVVISPVIARLLATGLSVAIDIKAANNEVPADGPSFGVAPIGT